MTGIGVVAFILCLVAVSWWRRGIDDAAELFHLLQGVLLATIAFLWGSQAADRAEATAQVEARSRERISVGAREATVELDDLKEETKRLRAILGVLAADEQVRPKLEEVLKQVGDAK